MKLMQDILREFRETDDGETLTVICKGEIVGRFKEFLEWISEKAAGGTGITIVATTDGNEKKEIYIDGDGADGIEVS